MTPLDDVPLRGCRFAGICVECTACLVWLVQGKQSTSVDLPQRERVEQQLVHVRRVEPPPASVDGVGELAWQTRVAGGSGEQRERGTVPGRGRRHGSGVFQPGDGGAEATCFAQLIAVHPQAIRQEVLTVEVAGEDEGFAGPDHSAGQAFVAAAAQTSSTRSASRRSRPVPKLRCRVAEPTPDRRTISAMDVSAPVAAKAARTASRIRWRLRAVGAGCGRARGRAARGERDCENHGEQSSCGSTAKHRRAPWVVEVDPCPPAASKGPPGTLRSCDGPDRASPPCPYRLWTQLADGSRPVSSVAV